MRITCLQTGVVREKQGARGVSRYLWAPWRAEALPVNTFLVEHPAGLCLFDAGQAARSARRGYFPAWHPFFRLARFELTSEDEVGAQLRSAGIELGDVRWVVVSHLHTDHVGGLGELPSSQVVVSRVEWERAQGVVGKMRGYLPQHWPHEVEPLLLNLEAGGFGPFPASHDLAGDDTLLIVATPGHTPGHVSLLVRRPSASVLLGGDLAHDRAALERDHSVIAGYCRQHGIAYAGAHDPHASAAIRESQTV